MVRALDFGEQFRVKFAFGEYHLLSCPQIRLQAFSGTILCYPSTSRAAINLLVNDIRAQSFHFTAETTQDVIRTTAIYIHCFSCAFGFNVVV